jgi:tRNA(Ile)-lysidine synthase
MLLSAVRDFCLLQDANKTYWVAYSGGLDSHVLLALMSELRILLSIQVKAIHINHGLSSNAEAWSLHCEKICRELAIPFIAHKIQITLQSGDSLEALARQKRYDLLARELGPNDILLTAHHQDDQAETVFLQLLRGAGPTGLAAMPSLKILGKALHGRPLLDFSQQDLVLYAEQNNLHWQQDESNDNTRYTRNFLRHEIFPLLKKRWSTVTQTVSRAAKFCAQADELLDQYVKKDVAAVQGSVPETLSIKKLSHFTAIQQRFILRSWIQQCGYDMPSAALMDTIQNNILTARWDRLPQLTWQNVLLRRYQDDLYLLPLASAHDKKQVYSWLLSHSLVLPVLGKLTATLSFQQGLHHDVQEVSVRLRQGGEYCRLPGRKQHHTLKKLFSAWRVLPWERDRMPLIFFAETLIAIPGLFLDREYMSQPGEQGWQLVFDKSPTVSRETLFAECE